MILLPQMSNITSSAEIVASVSVKRFVGVNQLVWFCFAAFVTAAGATMGERAGALGGPGSWMIALTLIAFCSVPSLGPGREYCSV